MAKDQANNVLQDSTFTGFSEDNSTVRVYNPITGEYEVKAVDNWKEYNPAGDKTNWMYTPEGTRVLGLTPEGYEDYGNYNNEPGFDHAWQAGYTPPEGEYRESELKLGPGDRKPSTSTTTDPNTGSPNDDVIDPITNNPTDDWFMPDEWLDYTNAPQPDGDGSFDDWHGKNKQSDTSWNWDAYRDRAPGDRQFGGYDEDYQAFERYIPGMDSPWGLPNVKGGNEDFYQQQFLNQLRDEQGYRSRQKAAQKRSNQAALNPYEAVAAEDVWSWANNGEGLRDVQMGGGAPEVQWDLNNAFTPGQSSIGDILTWASSADGFDQGSRNFYKTFMDSITQEGRDSQAWSRASDPTALKQQFGGGGLDRTNQNRMNELFDALYNPGQAGPYAPSGYASPVNQPAGGA
jgi:hypothetical protein